MLSPVVIAILVSCAVTVAFASFIYAINPIRGMAVDPKAYTVKAAGPLCLGSLDSFLAMEAPANAVLPTHAKRLVTALHEGNRAVADSVVADCDAAVQAANDRFLAKREVYLGAYVACAVGMMAAAWFAPFLAFLVYMFGIVALTEVSRYHLQVNVERRNWLIEAPSALVEIRAMAEEALRMKRAAGPVVDLKE